MTRLIDADALKEYIDCGHLRNPCEVCFSERDVVDLIDAQPTIDAVRHGKWIDRTIKVSAELTNIIHICSVCEEMAVGKYRYCPHCGARMDKERKEE
jgi:hypothetical protein